MSLYCGKLFNPYWRRILGDPSLLANYILAVLGIVGTGILLWQTNLTRQALEETKRQFKESKHAADADAARDEERFTTLREDAAKARREEHDRFLKQLAAQQGNAETSAGLTRRSIDESRQSFEIANRARLATSGFSRVQLQATVPFVIEASISNTGEVPAENVVALSTVFVTHEPLPDSPNISGVNVSAPGSSVGARLGFDVHIVLDNPIPDKAFVESVAEGASRLYYVGQIRYDDGFSKTRRTLWFCAQYFAAPVFGWKLCPNNNWSD